MTDPLVDILLATYNGEKHLGELLASLEAQTYRNWRLVMRDDGSSDNTVALARDWAARTGNTVKIIENTTNTKGSGANFSALMALSDAPYFCFCDQDDVWLPEKIATLLEALQQLERIAGEDVPLLAHSDLQVVSANLSEMHPSFWAMLHIDPVRAASGHSLLFQNVVTGCAMIGNASLRDAAKDLPDADVLHDWWCALVARYCGEMKEVPDATIRYRQHEENVVGARQWTLAALSKRFTDGPTAALSRARATGPKARSRAAALLEQFSDQLSTDARAILQELATIDKAGRWQRLTFMRRHRAGTGYWLRDAILVLFL